MQTQPIAKLRSLKTSRLTIGCFAVFSQTMAPMMPKAASDGHDPDERRAEPVFILAAIEHDLQAAEAERDEAEPDEVDMLARGLLRSQGGSSTSTETRKVAMMPTGMLAKKIQRQL